MRAAVIIPAAGRGLRMGKNINKQYLPLCGKPLLAHTLGACIDSQFFFAIIVVVTPGEEDFFRRDVLLPWLPQDKITIVTGGTERQDSVYKGLQALAADTDLVCIHDGARPLVSASLFYNCLSEAEQHGAAITAVPVKDTIKIVAANQVISTPPRDTLWAVQTPQAFRFDLLLNVHRRASSENFYATDDAALLERYGYAVRVVAGDYENIKVTTPEDLVVAETLIRGRQHADWDRL
ncbi:MAG: 2-C-methyl-D-erythritol 4-phosphate cytidylyltransferase [Dethiobacter sp.]|jgi:2-C-methyl-D-erythritol 4-phosphate cytidylyltransferase|nr:2-C-methyl-D-erythritol 4-phosphate cytidylyltransferase [Dethiobacter sp.]MBS3902107.1 2-C-methyl-D-erythritol 4-phosphate cytidylyltransferase [Dethiobacter sp.]MBS3988391.1 2-C-methyl-D-erythritol 4-phosphate cytidylyltransferase [Dethiobacter sp.]